MAEPQQSQGPGKDDKKSSTRSVSSTDLDTRIKKIFIDKKQRTFLTSHPAFGYFCKEYNCIQVPVEYQGKNPTLKQLEQTLALAKDKDVKIALLIPQENNKGAKLVAENLQIKSVFFNPLFCDFQKHLLLLANLIEGEDGSN